MMKRIFIFSAILVLMLSGGIFLHTPSAHATFNSSDLIDDFTFDDTNTMSANAIDVWVNSTFGSASCISVSHGFSAPDPTGYSPGGGFTYGGNVSAGQVIYDAANAYGLNPQVLLTTMQKEQSLVSGGGGCGTLSYAGAMGYGCPDSGTTHNYSGVDLYTINGVNVTSVSGTCVSSIDQVGFSQQVIHAAWLLKFGEQRSQGNTGFDVQATNFPETGDSWNNSDDPQTCYEGPMTAGTFMRCSTDPSPVYYDGYTTIDGVSTLMSDGATAALYWYTPHFAGNENFDSIFNSYFGSQFANDTFTPHPNGSLIIENNAVYLMNNNLKDWIANPDVFDSYDFNWANVVRGSTGDANLSYGPTINTFAPGTLFTSPGLNAVYVMNYIGGTLEAQPISLAAFLNLGYQWSQIMTIPNSEVPTAITGTFLTAYQHPVGALVSYNNAVYQIMTDSNNPTSGVLRHIVTPTAFESYNFNWGYITPATTLDIQNYPVGEEMDVRVGTWALANNNIYLVNSDTDGDYIQPVGPWECFSNRLGYSYSNLQVAPMDELPSRIGGLFTC